MPARKQTSRVSLQKLRQARETYIRLKVFEDERRLAYPYKALVLQLVLLVLRSQLDIEPTFSCLQQVLNRNFQWDNSRLVR